jgi:hypothetical protein
MSIIVERTDMRNEKGQFIKGVRSHPETEFKPGQHWREHKPFWDKAWLQTEYTDKQRSAGEIAAEFGTTESAILFWLRKHGIPRRTISEARDVKRWGASREGNPMYGKRGPESPSWKGGSTPERQSLYSSLEWTDAVETVWQRDRGLASGVVERIVWVPRCMFTI